MKSIIKWAFRIAIFLFAIGAVQDEISRYFGHGQLAQLAGVLIFVPTVAIAGYLVLFWDSFSDRFLSDPWLGNYQNGWMNKPRCKECRISGNEYSVEVATELKEEFGKQKEYFRKPVTEHECLCSNGHSFSWDRKNKY